MQKYLITSKDSRTWRLDRKLLFLGEFCVPFSREKIFQEINAEIEKPFGLSIEERENNYKITKELKEKILNKIYKALNKIHDVSYTKIEWQILIGDWITRYVDTMYNRIKTVEICLSRNEISEISIRTVKNYKLFPKTSLEAIDKFNDDDWNDAIFGIILKRRSGRIKVNELIDEKLTNNSSVDANNKVIKPKKIIGRIVYNFNKLSFRLFGRKNDAFFITTYLDKSIEVRLQLKLGQYPVIWNIGYEMWGGAEHGNDGKRVEFKNSISKIKNSDELEAEIIEMLPEIIPSNFIENFEILEKQVEKTKWPINPKFIFTSNNFDCDDVFKLYVVKSKRQCGSGYLIGCHGNGFFKYFENPSNSEEVADKYITWGWHHGLKQHKRGYIFTVAGKTKKYDENGGLLLVQHPLFNRVVTWDVIADHSRYHNEQCKLVKALNLEIQMNVTIRLHSATKKRGWGEYDRWKSLGEHIKVDLGNSKIDNLIKKSRIIVFGYDSTGFSEMMALNIPAMVYLQVGFEQLNINSMELYKSLMLAGIAHTSAEAMAQKINEIWDDVDKWWNSELVQSSKIHFCNNYARLSNDVVNDFYQILME